MADEDMDGGDEFSAGEEEGDFEEGGGQEEEMVEFITNGRSWGKVWERVCVCVWQRKSGREAKIRTERQ
jgi:hypothetical protein